MTETAPPWVSWRQDDLPCLFTKEQTAENCALLKDILGRSWLNTAQQLTEHPILSRWVSGGAGSFLELNGLADDVRLVRDVPGLDTVLHDLKNPRSAESAWHVIHGAALFERHTRGSVVKFFLQTGESAPDLLIRLRGSDIPTEAKLLTKSEAQEKFERYASKLVKTLFEQTLAAGRVHPAIYVVVKDSLHTPPSDEIVSVITRLLSSYDASPATERATRFNVFLDVPPQVVSGLPSYRSCYVLCPKSTDEDLRVEDRGKKASKQLRAYGEGQHAGIFLLGVGLLNDGYVVATLLRRKFTMGFFKGISGAIIVHRGTCLALPMRTVVDVIGFVQNTAAPVALPEDLGISPLGLVGKFEAPSPDAAIPAYRFGAVEAQRGSASRFGLLMPDIRVLTPELLR